MRIKKYLPNTCLLTDFYQLTMAQAYFDHKRADLPAVYHWFFRKNPFENGNFAVAAGISDALSFIENFHFDKDSLTYLKTLKNEVNKAYFSESFIDYLAHLSPKLCISGVKDGDIVFPHEPLLRIEGPLALCQLLETPILNIVNFQTLIATKAARMVIAAKNKPIIDFGLRRAQGFDGGISASKAAFIGGVSASSNLWAAKHFNLPVAGTHSHSFIMSYEQEEQAFSHYAESFPDSTTLVIDTYQSEEGLKKAIKILTGLQKNGHKSLGVRLDSGELLSLSKKVRYELNNASLNNCKIVASGDLDEYSIAHLTKAQAPIDVFGVGTRLITAHGDPALGGVYKLAAIQEHGKDMRYTHKKSDTALKATWPGPLAFFRYLNKDKLSFDLVVDPKLGPSKIANNYDEMWHMYSELMNKGQVVWQSSLLDSQKYCQKSLSKVPDALLDISRTAPAYAVFFDEVLKKRKNNIEGENK